MLDHHALDDLAGWDDRVPVHVAPPDHQVESVDDAPAVIGTGVEVVHTSVGALSRLLDLEPWAAAVAGVLRDGDVLAVGHQGLSPGGPQRARAPAIEAASRSGRSVPAAAAIVETTLWRAKEQ